MSGYFFDKKSYCDFDAIHSIIEFFLTDRSINNFFAASP